MYNYYWLSRRCLLLQALCKYNCCVIIIIVSGKIVQVNTTYFNINLIKSTNLLIIRYRWLINILIRMELVSHWFPLWVSEVFFIDHKPVEELFLLMHVIIKRCLFILHVKRLQKNMVAKTALYVRKYQRSSLSILETALRYYMTFTYIF